MRSARIVRFGELQKKPSDQIRVQMADLSHSLPFAELQEIFQFLLVEVDASRSESLRLAIYEERLDQEGRM